MLETTAPMRATTVPSRRAAMPDLRRLPLPQDGWTVRAMGGEGSPLVGSREIEAGPFMQASIHAVLAHAGVQQPWKGERAELDSEWGGRTEWTFAREIEGQLVAHAGAAAGYPGDAVLFVGPVDRHVLCHVPLIV